MAAAPQKLDKPKRIRYAPVLKKLMEDRDKEGALQMIKDMSGSTHAYHINNFMKHVRERIAKDPQYFNPKCLDEIREIMNTPGINDHDRIKLSELLDAPKRIRWAQVQTGIFVDPAVRKRIKDIRVYDPMYYEFVPSEDVVRECAEYKKTLIDHNHRHVHKAKDRYNFSNEEMDEMIKAAAAYCEDQTIDWTKRKNSLRLLEACCLLTGRRKWELCKTLQMRSSPVSDHQAIVSGIGKNLQSGDQERPIPLLAPIATVAKGIVNLRRYAHKFGDYYQTPKAKLLPKLTHNTFRDLYCKRAWRDRAINQFMPQQCSEMYWCSQALCDQLSTYAMHYTTAVIHHGEPDFPDHRQLQPPQEPGHAVDDQQQVRDLEFQDGLPDVGIRAPVACAVGGP
jgi:hypothetical protein